MMKKKKLRKKSITNNGAKFFAQLQEKLCRYTIAIETINNKHFCDISDQINNYSAAEMSHFQ
jgi:spore coat polysaccharide biosynthesis predicted glycosyltransferase SpsG